MQPTDASYLRPVISVDHFLDAARDIVGSDHIVLDNAEKYIRDWRGKFEGRPLAVLLPKSTKEVAALVKLCAHHCVAIVPQGGNTGLCGGAIPDSSGEQVVLNLGRMNQVLAIDPANNTMTVQAGCILQTIQDVAREADRLFPLALGAQGSCQIGGNLSTNAGGIQVLRYGNARELVLGLEVVLPSGEVLNMLRGLRKDNTGYDLKQMFIGAEGTLGVITAAILKLFPQPASTSVVWVALESVSAAVRFLSHMRLHLDDRLTGFELMGEDCVSVIHKRFPDSPAPIANLHPWFVLVRASGSESDDALRSLVEQAVMAAIDSGLIADAALATSGAQGDALWKMRENVAEAQQHHGPHIKHDVSLPVSVIADFLDLLRGSLAEKFPSFHMMAFGHLGDGNLHVNVFVPVERASEIDDLTPSINGLVHELVSSLSGSISAEHGIGQLKRETLRKYKSEVEIALMNAIKRAIDPQFLMNPGKVIG